MIDILDAPYYCSKPLMIFLELYQSLSILSNDGITIDSRQVQWLLLPAMERCIHGAVQRIIR